MTCPKCSAAIKDLDEEELDEGDPVTCEECGADLKVASLHPVEFEPAEAETEDEDEDDLDDEEEEDDEEDFEEDEEKDDEWS